MTLVLETGTSIQQANAYVDIVYVDEYLAKRNRQTENNWSTTPDAAKEAAIIAATDYIELRWGTFFKGQPLSTSMPAVAAVTKLTFTGQPLDSEYLSIGSTKYTFVTVLAAANDVLIGATDQDSVNNLVAAINGALGSGSLYGVGTAVNSDMGASNTLLVITLTASYAGYAGNFLTTTGTVAAAAFADVRPKGGADLGPQPLSFPRKFLYNKDCTTLLPAMPLALLQATAEYASRALGSTLLPDPVVDASGQALLEKTEKVGPITEQIKYQFSESLVRKIRPYPAADNLLKGLVSISGSGVIRG